MAIPNLHSRQQRPDVSWRIIGATLLSGLAILGAMALFAALVRVPVETLTQDTVSVLHAPFYTGLLSNLGILLWCATAAICLFSAFLLGHAGIPGDARAFLFTAGGLSAILVLDDLLLLHERSLEDWVAKSDLLFYAAYAILLLWFLARFRRVILHGDFVLLLTALGCFGISILLDIQPDEWSPVPGVSRYFFEDSFKFIGILFWSVYFLKTAAAHVSSALRGAANPVL